MLARTLRFVLVLVTAMAVGFFVSRFFWPNGSPKTTPIRLTTPLPPVPIPPFSRPYGMAPAAFQGFMRACQDSKIHPYRIGQTIGDHPRSAGYHKRDGVLNFRGEKLDYTAAVDIGTFDLTRAQIKALLENLAKQGFAAFYREGPNWKGGEHIHAIYAALPMKPQLRRQVREWVRARRKSGKAKLRWQVASRRFWINS